MTTAAQATTRAFRTAMLAGDLDGLTATFARDVSLRSPISTAAQFAGRDEVRELMSVVLPAIAGLEYLAEVGDEHERVLHARARAGRQAFEEAIWLRFDDDGRIAELVLFVRPLAGLTALAAALAPRLAGRHGRLRAAVAKAMTGPLAAITRNGDPIALRLAGIRRR